MVEQGGNYALGELGEIKSPDTIQQAKIFSCVGRRSASRAASDFVFRSRPGMQSAVRDVPFQRRRMA